MYDFLFKKLHLILILATIFFLLAAILQHREIFLSKYNPDKTEKEYYSSQWAVKNSKHSISDTTLYSYAGYKYIKGGNPILVNPEHPPLGKYLIGVSILLLGNERIFSLIAGFISLLLIYYIIQFTTNSKTAASIGVFLTATHDLFLNQLFESPQLDIFQILFFLLLFVFLLLYFSKPRSKYLVLAGLSFGTLISIKTFPIYFVLFNSWLVLFLLFKFGRQFRPSIKILTSINLIGLFVYTLSYASYFIYAGTFRGFLGVQKYVAQFYRTSAIDGSKILGDYLGLVFFNEWRFWTEGYPLIHYSGWSITWPLLILLGIYSIVVLGKRIKDVKIKTSYLALVSFILIYNIFLFVTPIYPRYLLFLFITLIILISMTFHKIITNKNEF